MWRAAAGAALKNICAVPSPSGLKPPSAMSSVPARKAKNCPVRNSSSASPHCTRECAPPSSARSNSVAGAIVTLKSAL